MATLANDPNYYKNKIPSALAQQTADKLGITTDQLFKYYAQAGNPNVVSMVASQGPGSNQYGGGFGSQTPYLNTTGIMPFVAAGQAAASAPGAPGGGTQAGPGSYWGVNPTIGAGSGTIGGGAGGTGGGNATMANGQQPESVALGQMAQIDPQSEALRQALAGSYLGPLAQGAPQMGPPSAANIQSYLNLYNKIDPTGLAGRRALEQQLTSQAALGSQLDPVTQREIEQSVRTGQAARGNVYGTPQLVQEAMTTGQAGLALQAQRQAALQGLYSSGQDIGTTAQGLYQTGLSNYLNQMANYRAAQSAAGGYLTSGATPYQAGASYLNQAENRAATAAQGGAVYNPQGLGSYYTGAGAPSFPQYGLDVSQLANQWQQSMNYGQYAGYNAQLAGQRSGGSGASIGMGAAKGAASGALTGLAAGPWGALIGAGVGALGGAASGAFSG